MGGLLGGGNNNTTSSTVAQPWEGAEGPLRGAYQTAADIFAAGAPPFYPGTAVTSQSPYTQTAIGLQAQRGLLGSPLIAAAQNAAGGFASGQGLGLFAPGQAASQGLLGQVMGGQNWQQGANAIAPYAWNIASGNANNPIGSGLLGAGQQGLYAALNGNPVDAGLLGGLRQSLGTMMAGQGGFLSPQLLGTAQQGFDRFAGGGANPLGARVDDAVGGLARQGADGIGLQGGLGTTAAQALGQQMTGGNPFQGLLQGSMSGVGGLLGQGAANGVLPAAQDAWASLASGRSGFVDPGLAQAGRQGLYGYAAGDNFGGAAPARSDAQGLLSDTLRGRFAGGENPYLGGMIESATRPMLENFQRSVVPAIQSAASAAGRYGSGAMSDALAQAGTDLTRQIGDVGSQLGFQSHAMERGLQNAGIGTALQDYLGQQGLQMQGLDRIQSGAQADTGNRLAAASGIAGLRGQDLSALSQGAGLAGQLFGQGAGQTLAASQAALGALASQGALQQSANQGVLSGYLQGSGQQLQGLGLLGTLYGNDANRQLGATQLGLDAYGRGQTLAGQVGQGLIGADLQRGGQQMGAINALLGQGNQQTANALTAAGLGQQGWLNAAQQQLAGLGLAPQLAAQDYVDINAIGQAGGMQDAYSQAQINADIDRYNYGINAPWQYLNQYVALLNNTPWGTTSTVRPPQQSGFQGALGGALTGAGIGTLAAPGIGTAIGGLLGGGLGLFGR